MSIRRMDLPGHPSLWVSLMTGPFLVSLVSAKLLSDWMQQVGFASEELFRGDRLPVLNMMPPDAHPHSIEEDDSAL